jgi:transcriptional antiterminator RfaH
MPYLTRQPDCFPSDLFEVSSAIDQCARWWALYTMSRREKELMRRLIAAEISFYGPLIELRKRSPTGRIRTAHLPLFPGYVFLYGNDDQRRTALTTNCVSRCLEVNDGHRLWHDLRQIRQLVEAEVALMPEARLTVGQRIRVLSGSLTGVEGTVIKRHGRQRLLVAIEFLQQGASVQIDDCDVECVDL